MQGGVPQTAGPRPAEAVWRGRQSNAAAPPACSLGSKVAFISSSAGAKALNKYFPGVEEPLSSPPEVLETPLGPAGSRNQRKSRVCLQLGEEGSAELPPGQYPPSWQAEKGPAPLAYQAWEAAGLLCTAQGFCPVPLCP